MPAVKYLPYAIMVAVTVGGVILGNQYVGKLGELDQAVPALGHDRLPGRRGHRLRLRLPDRRAGEVVPETQGPRQRHRGRRLRLRRLLFKATDPSARSASSQEHDIVPFFVVHGIVCLVAVTRRRHAAAQSARHDDRPPRPLRADSTWQDTLKRPAFYLLWLMFFSGAMAGLMVIGIVKRLRRRAARQGRRRLHPAAEAAAAKAPPPSASSPSSTPLGRVAWGFVSDRIGRTPAFIADVRHPGRDHVHAGRLEQPNGPGHRGRSLVGFNFGGNFALFPSATADLFGAKNLGANYGWVFTSYGIAGVVGVAAGNAAKVMTGSYATAFAAAGVLCIVAAVGAAHHSMGRKPAQQTV